MIIIFISAVIEAFESKMLKSSSPHVPSCAQRYRVISLHEKSRKDVTF